MNDAAEHFILTVSCPDTVGIVAAVAGFLSVHDAFITESVHFGDEDTGQFFMRTVFRSANGRMPDLDQLRTMFADVAVRFAMTWGIHPTSERARVLIMVSKFDHCLNDLLYRYRIGQLAIDVPAVISNHPDLEPLVRWHDIPFHHLPVTAATRSEQEAAVTALVGTLRIDLVVLARYMQVLSPALCRLLEGRCINIHHSFLPGFKGARPYHQAHARGVKIIGATAHYVTENLDEGPIIEQAVERIDHGHTAQAMVAIGRDIENVVLARAVQWHVERRVFVNGRKTVVLR
jgi:formyltetrahydrofolate deformylase